MMRLIIVTLWITSIIVIGNTIGEITTNQLQPIYKERIAPMFLLDTSSNFYHVYSLKEHFPYLPIRKVGHFFFYGFIAIILFNIVTQRNLFARGILAIALAILIGLVDEIYQYLLVGRSGLFLDVLVDATGSFTLVHCLLIWKGFEKLRNSSPVSIED